MVPPETERVWDFLRQQPSLAGFILIGGTALALRIRHRRSEDLDLVYPEARLPLGRLEALRHVAVETGQAFEADEDEATIKEFADASLDLRDYQQNYIVNRAVKVSFFVPDGPLAKVLEKQPATHVRVASLAELFKSKCLVCARRSKTRDWLDLYLLLHQHGFTIHDLQQSFRDAGIESQSAIALSRLCSGVPQSDDEGYAHLLPNPPSLAEMTQYFIAQRDLLEIHTSEQALRTRQDKNPPQSPAPG